MLRPPAVAGQFYPDSPDALRAFLARAVPADAEPEPAIGVVSPHAGYVYSGEVAGAVFARVDVPDTALLLGPNHTGLGTEASIVCRGRWRTPLGDVDVDEDLAEALRDATSVLHADDRAHAREHSLEVQVPFLQHRNPRVRIVPVAFLLRTYDEIEQVGRAIARVLAGRDDVLLVASSDMTHYEPDRVAREKDQRALERVCALDPRGLLDTARAHRITMCGVVPTAVLLVAARELGATGAEVVRYATSGDVNRDYSSVVGYAGVIVR